MEKHRSNPYNPDIANTFFRAGFIESWGRGIEKICSICKEYGNPIPEYTVHANDIMICFRTKVAESEVSQKNTVGDKSVINACQKILKYLAEHPASKTKDIASYINLKISRTKDYLSILVKEDKIVPLGENKNRVYSLKE